MFTEEALEAGHAWTRDLRPAGDAGSKRLEHLGVRVRRAGAWCLQLTVQDIDAFERRTASDDANTYHRRGLSEWRRAERYFREIERDNQLILAAAGEGIYGVNADGVTTFLNPAAETMLGYAAAELVGRQLHAIIHHHRADGSVYPDAECPIYAAFRQGEVKTVDDEVFWRRDGGPLRVEYTSTPIVDAGAVVGAVVVFRDITGRKRAEERLNATLAENARLRERLEQENAYLQEEIRDHGAHADILGTSAAIGRVLRQIELVAPTGASVLITGESGTGKELVARAIHDASPRCERPLIRVNCAAVPRELFESEFFGHVKGSFSGAVRDRVGRFELADGPGSGARDIRTLQDYDWPGNARELQNVIERAVILATDGKLRLDLPRADASRADPGRPPGTPGLPERVLSFAEIEAPERENIRRALEACGGRVAGDRGAALLLGTKPSTLYSRLKAGSVPGPGPNDAPGDGPGRNGNDG